MPSDPRQGLPRARRLRRRADFQRIYTHGIRVAGRYMVLFALPAEGGGRFGVTASRKVGGAVARARCRRRLRELYRTRVPAGSTPPVDLVANARRSVAIAPWRALELDFDCCFERVTERLTTQRR